MGIAEIKVDILRQIASTNDVQFLREVLAYIQTIRKNQDWWDELSEETVASILKGNQELEEGKGIQNNILQNQVRQIVNAEK